MQFQINSARFGVYIIWDKSQPAYEIVSHNGILGVESIYPTAQYNYTVYVDVKNVRASMPTNLHCELTREDLSKIIKQQIFFDKRRKQSHHLFLFKSRSTR